MQITEDRRKRVIDLYFNQHKTYAEITQIERMSPHDIHAIIKEEKARRQKYKQQETSAQAYELFSQGKTPIDVAIILNLPASKVSKLYREYWDLKGLDKLNTIHEETNGKIWTFLKLYNQLIKKRHMSIEQVVNVVEIAIHKLPYMESLYKQAKDEAENMQRTIQRLANDTEERKNKISFLDRIAFSIEQGSKTTEQRVQELTSQKDILERLIANISNGEGYSKLKQVVKESVKAVLSDDKILISVSFVAIIQTLNSDPHMASLIYNIPRANDGKPDDNTYNITKFIEANKDKILDLAEKNYENLVEALTNNAISSADASSSPIPY